MRSLGTTNKTDHPLVPVVIAAGSNLGDREWHLRRAIDRLRGMISVVRVSSVYSTAAVDSPRGAPDFLNLVLAGMARTAAGPFLDGLKRIEQGLGRRRSVRNAPRIIDLDLIFYGALMIRERGLEIPHPRYRTREFVLAPLRELALPWVDPSTGEQITSLRGEGIVRRGDSIGAIRP
ncbi:MAG: 2-amino-4-hydroxy-6-hydroxymethyldihydropteridine diphosphokinase [Acidobacteriota bacterium]